MRAVYAVIGTVTVILLIWYWNSATITETTSSSVITTVPPPENLLCPICQPGGHESMRTDSLEAMNDLAKCGNCRILRQESWNCSYSVADLAKLFAGHSDQWNTFGKENAWWSVLTQEEFKGQDISLEMKKKFYQTSEVGPNEMRSFVQQHLDKKRDLALDFGCGLGRISLAISKYFDQVICTDQSINHLNTAQKSLRELFPKQAHKIQFLLNTLNLVDNVYNLASSRVDAVFSYIALQHALQPLQLLFIEQFCDILKTGGIGQFQVYHVDTYSEHKHVCEAMLNESIRKGGMQMLSISTEEISRHLEWRGCKVIETHFFDYTSGSESQTISFTKL